MGIDFIKSQGHHLVLMCNCNTAVVILKLLTLLGSEKRGWRNMSGCKKRNLVTMHLGLKNKWFSLSVQSNRTAKITS